MAPSPHGPHPLAGPHLVPSRPPRICDLVVFAWQEDGYAAGTPGAVRRFPAVVCAAADPADPATALELVVFNFAPAVPSGASPRPTTFAAVPRGTAGPGPRPRSWWEWPPA